MGIKDRLQRKRDELYGKFVSVKALLEFMASVEGIDPSEVAIALFQAFEETNVSSMPAYGWADAQQIKFVSFGNDADPWEHLKELLLTVADRDGFDVGDHFGWIRDEIFKFLGEHGFDIPENLPAWKPQEVPSPMRNTNYVTNDFVDKPLGSKERNTLLCVIAGILDKHVTDVNNPERGTAKKIENWVLGVGANVKEETIKGILDKLPEAVAARSSTS
jgi:hypothetical protein